MKTELDASVTKLAATHQLTLGNDLVHLPGFEASLTNEFITKVYTPAELAYCHSFSKPLLRFASTWAAKEAVYKAVKQIYAGALGWRSIEITRQKAAGKPTVTLPLSLKHLTVSLTITHDGDYVWAMAAVQQL